MKYDKLKLIPILNDYFLRVISIPLFRKLKYKNFKSKEI